MPSRPAIAATITALRNTTPNTRIFTLLPGAADYCFRPGQHCLLSVDGERFRPFSFTTTPRQCPRFELVVKLAGVVTGQLHQCTVGSQVWITQPLVSRFFIDADDHGAVVFLAGGTGLTPFLSLIRDCTEHRAENPLTLLFANQTAEDIICRAELDALAHENPHFTVAYTIDAPAPGWHGEVGRIDLAMIRRHVPDLAAPRFMVCGRPPMVVALRQLLLEAGVAPGRIAV